MDMTGEYRIPAPRARVWEALNDPEVLRGCIPGCEAVEKQSDTEFTARVTAKVGPVKAKFTGKVTLSEVDPPNGYVITGEGSGGVAGFGKGGATVRLADAEEGGTVLTYVAHASVGGKLAQIGSRLVDATARKMADDFFACFAALLSSGGPVAAAPAIAPAAESPAPESPPPGGPASGGALPGAVLGATPGRIAAGEASAPAADPVVAREGPGVTHERSQESTGQMTEAAALAAAAAPEVAAGMEPPGRLAEADRGGVPPKVWIPALVVVVAVLLWIFA
jgi:carbon monoxide dehydrogenase subunit G